MDNNVSEQILQEELQTLAANGKIDSFREKFLDMHPYDQASFFIEQPEEIRLNIYTYLSPEETAGMMEHIELDDIKPLFTEMDPRYAAMVIEEMATDDAVDMLNELEKDVVVSLLTIMDAKNAAEIKELLHYEEKTAGSIMTTEFVAVYESKTVQDTMQYLKAEAPEAETIYYLYVVDEDKHLVGVVSLRDLIIAEPDMRVADVMSEKVLSVSVAKDQEEVARMIRDYDFLAIPVVDFQNHLLGIITVDDILDVMEEEAGEDYSMLAGVSDKDSPKDSAFISAKKRLPWLVILLFLGMLTASLIGQFEEALEQVAVLAIFIPLLAGMAGNTGTQALAVAVRGLSTGDYGKQGKLRLMFREASTGLINGIVCGTLLTGIVYFWQDDIYLGMLVGFSIMVILVIATLAGALVPIFMDRLNIDPAVASGPFITTINDIISILIYFGLATMFMQYLV
ncbi:magnesium transporter MgtE [Lentibacillus kapialis]|uniref:Magnesium transporter MgtE n=1 Tax=Lentibacillus kapialis TaxID=340214 RepID=A0A917PWH3_9BACI|nr:magnesium transporter [Lentibacillus kapialis]GGJ95119.1 magnesium transporter MgtE [Lentibacillus kapialis]